MNLYALRSRRLDDLCPTCHNPALHSVLYWNNVARANGRFLEIIDCTDCGEMFPMSVTVKDDH